MLSLKIDQQSEKWFKEKCGKPSASNFDKILTTKGALSKQVRKYLYQLAGERVSGIREEGYTNGYMQRGIELEKEAREFYELIKGVKVEQVGLCYPDEDKKYLCSPDGLVGDDGLIEIKCPAMATHVGYLIEEKFLADYFQQVQGQLLVTGRKWCDLISYYPAIKPAIVRVERDEKFIKALKDELDSFCAALEDVVKKISQEA